MLEAVAVKVFLAVLEDLLAVMAVLEHLYLQGTE
jgi:hypothetical protein